MNDSSNPLDSNGGASRAVGLGVLIALAIAGLLVAAYVIGYNRANQGDQAANNGKPAPTKTGTTIDAKALFVEKCGACHVLKEAGTAGTSGPDLDQLNRPAPAVEKKIASGGASMPAELLQGKESEEVADFVAKSTGG